MFEIQKLSTPVLAGSHHHAILGFYPSFRQIPWADLLRETNRSIDIMVYYWNKWVKEYEDELIQFLNKTKSQLRLFLADDQLPEVFSEIQRLFPNNKQEELREKIARTYQPLQHFLEQNQLSLSKLEVYKLPHVLNYSLQCFDGKILVMSFFEMFRDNSVDGPAIAIDLEVAPTLKDFYLKEIEGAIKKGTRD
jgi:hypothetical protein